MHRLVLLAIVVGCDRPAPPPVPTPPAYAALPISWPVPAVGALGRAEAPQPLVSLPIAGGAHGLHLATPWQVPDAPRAVLYGLDDKGQPAVELIDIDAGRVLWRDLNNCAGPIVGVTAKAIVCADAKGVRAAGMDGKSLWRLDAAFVAMTDDRVVTAGAGEAVVTDADDGGELARVALPAPVQAGQVLASCGDAGRELFAQVNDRLVRVAEAKGGPKVVWSIPIPEILTLDACDGPVIAFVNDHSLIAYSRDKGARLGSVNDVRGFWPSGARVMVATAQGVASYPRELTTPIPTPLPPLAEVLARRGNRTLVRATPHSAVILDGAKVLAYLPFPALGGALGDRSFVTASWTGGAGESVRRFALPAVHTGELHLATTPGVMVAAELRDLPAPTTPATPIASTGTARLIALDPEEPSALYVATGEGAIARAELPKAWAWTREGCVEPTALATARARVICAGAGYVRALSVDGRLAWKDVADADALLGAGDLVVERIADTSRIIDARDGRRLGELAGPAVPIARGRDTWLVAIEHGRLVARAWMSPVWSLDLHGVVASIQPAGEGVVVTLDDGDAYRVELATARVIPLPGLGLAWTASPDVLVGATRGGPLPAPLPPPPPPPKRIGPPPKYDPEAAYESVPIAIPPPLGWSLQLALYEPRGGLRVRNDYALTGALAPRLAGAPLVLRTDTDLLVIETHRGDPIQRIPLDRGALPFATVVDGKPVAGAVRSDPLGFELY